LNPTQEAKKHIRQINDLISGIEQGDEVALLELKMKMIHDISKMPGAIAVLFGRQMIEIHQLYLSHMAGQN
jgi:hypothetical protein